MVPPSAVLMTMVLMIRVLVISVLVIVEPGPRARLDRPRTWLGRP
ncbi:hypothetical protein ACWEN3_31465 [Streptomyces sp. NPDC004561]